MLRFMQNNNGETVDDLKGEIVDLKLSSIRKDMATNKVDMHRHMDLVIEKFEEKLSHVSEKFDDRFARVLEQTSKTNGSVARAMEKIAEIERQDVATKLEELRKEVEEHKKKMRPWSIISTTKWVRVVLIAILVLVGLQFGTGITLFELIKMII